MQARTRYLATETLISCAINAALSVLFVIAVFHGQARVPVLGLHGIVADCVPQTFMVVLMACMVPSLIARRRLNAGRLLWWAPQSSATVARLVMTAFLVAALATCITVGIAFIILPHVLPEGTAFRPLLIAKAVFGALLAAITTPWSVLRVDKMNVSGSAERAALQVSDTNMYGEN